MAMLLAQPTNPGPTAELYSSLAAVLAGFAFTGLVLILSAQLRIGAEARTAADANGGGDGKTGDPIVMTLFYAMSSLTICSFLYGRAAGETVATGRTYLTLALYGVVLAPAVLSLFYALGLIMASRTATALTSVNTRWVVAAVGPAVVLSLLADLLANSWSFGCEGDCSAWASPRLWGFVLAAAFLVFGLMMSLLVAQNTKDSSLLQPLKRLVRRFYRLNLTGNASKYFQEHESSPGFITLILTAAVAIFSLWARGLPDGFNPRLWTHVLLIVAALVMGVFTFAAGSVLDKVELDKLEAENEKNGLSPWTLGDLFRALFRRRDRSESAVPAGETPVAGDEPRG